MNNLNKIDITRTFPNGNFIAYASNVAIVAFTATTEGTSNYAVVAIHSDGDAIMEIFERKTTRERAFEIFAQRIANVMPTPIENGMFASYSSYEELLDYFDKHNPADKMNLTMGLMLGLNTLSKIHTK